MERFCRIRDIYRSISEFEHNFEAAHGLCLNEGMLLCTIKNSAKEMLSSGFLADSLGLTCSNTSKLIKAVEEQGYISRVLGKEDKRQMYFKLTKKGKEKIEQIHCQEIDIPELLREVI
jgi:DNA-binding MarR family transcriptional regulator